MKKILVLAACALALTATASAQDCATAEICITVEYPVTIDLVRDMDCPTVTRGPEAMTYEVPEGQTAQFVVKGDAGDNIMLTWPESVELESDHAVVPSVSGPGGYEADYNGDMTLTFTPNPMYRFVNNDEEHALSWFLPTWTAPEGYCDLQGDMILRCIDASYGLDPGQGQINVYVGGTFDIAADQQRGTYTGELTMCVDYAP